MQSFQQLTSGIRGEEIIIASQPIDTTKPMDIVEEEELDRISGLLQRENLIRGLGIPEHVFRLLNHNPSLQYKVDPRHQQVSKGPHV